MTILITGSNGFIGKNIVKEFDNVLTPTRHELELQHEQSVKEYLSFYKPSIIIHLAANPIAKPDEKDPYKIVYDNIDPVLNLCKHSNPYCYFLFMSSIVVYGNTPRKMVEADSTRPISLYGLSKKYSEDIVRAYKKHYLNLRICATVGPHLTHGAVIDFVHKLKSPSKKLELFGDCPGSIKPYLHIEDLISFIKFCINNKIIGEYNLTPDSSISIDEVSDLVISGLGIFKEKEWLGKSSTWAGDNNILQASNNLVKSLGFDIKHDSQNAIYDTIYRYYR